MGGALIIHNKTAIPVKVTLKSHGVLVQRIHCQDTILAGGRHDYSLAKFNYDIFIEGADDNILQNSIGRDARNANNVKTTDGSLRKRVLPAKLAGLDASKSGGSTKELYVFEFQKESGDWQLALCNEDMPPSGYSGSEGQHISQVSVVNINT